MGILAGGKKKVKNEQKNIWSKNDWECPQNKFRYQTTDPGSLENTKQNKHLKTNVLAHCFQITEY